MTLACSQPAQVLQAVNAEQDRRRWLALASTLPPRTYDAGVKSHQRVQFSDACGGGHMGLR
jgi:hypothetical protein